MKRKNRRILKADELAVFSFSPAEVILMSNDEDEDGSAIVTTVSEITDEWLDRIYHFSRMYDKDIPEEFNEYAENEIRHFTNSLELHLEKVKYVALPVENELDVLMGVDYDNVDLFTYLLHVFATLLHKSITEMAINTGRHVLLIPYMGNMLDDVERSIENNNLPWSMLSKILLLINRRICRSFLETHSQIPGLATVIEPVESDDGKTGDEVDYRNYKRILAIHRSPQVLAATANSLGHNMMFSYPEMMNSNTCDLSEEEMDFIEKWIDDILDTYQTEDVLVIEENIDLDTEDPRIPSEHLAIISYFLKHILIMKSIESGMHVIMARTISRETSPAMDEFNSNTDEIMARRLLDYTAAFLDTVAELPGLVTII